MQDVIKITYLFHSGVFLELDNKKILIDVFTGKNIKNHEVNNNIDYSRYENVDYIFVSHEHGPHCDVDFIKKVLAKRMTKLICPNKVTSYFTEYRKSLIPVAIGDEFDLDRVRIKVVKAVHPQSSCAVGYIFYYSGKSLYYTGDTYKFTDVSKITADIVILPIGGRYTMDTYDAATFARDVRAKYAIPIHYNTYPMISQDVNEFVEYLDMVKITPIILKNEQSIAIKCK
ncbi:MAG: MBL fold metallo-hydrolase [Candidatus Micrarchaeota archaeon]|nr:MBL fold metallo-hydrolase [Candidatus Micrarchaeota archaeon]